MTRIGPLPLLLLLSLLGCGSTPGAIPATEDSITDTPSGDTVSATVIDTASGSSTMTNDTSGTDSQTADTTLPTASDSATDSLSDVDTLSGSDSGTASATGSDSATSSATDSATDTAPTPCELLAADDPDLVCCPVEPPDSCLPSDWTFSERDRTYGCCAVDLTSRVKCDNGSTLLVEYCAQGCGVSYDSLFCVENSCDHPYAVTEFPHTLTGTFTDYTNSFTPTDPTSCGDGGGGEDVWFLVRVPGSSEVVVTEATTTNTTLRLVSGCGVGSCLDKAEDPETMTLSNTGDAPKTFTLILSEATPISPIFPPTSFELIFSLQPR